MKLSICDWHYFNFYGNKKAVAECGLCKADMCEECLKKGFCGNCAETMHNVDQILSSPVSCAG